MKKHTKILSLILAVVMIMSVIPMTASAETIIDSGTYGENITWTLDSEYTLTISGSGAMQDTSSLENVGTTIVSTTPWLSYTNKIKKIVISSEVTSIGEDVFRGCTALKEIEFNSGVKTISHNAFYDCTALESIYIPATVELIEDRAFGDCTSIKSIHIGDGNVVIADGAFSYCYSLEELYIEGASEISLSFDPYLCMGFSNYGVLEGITILSDTCTIIDDTDFAEDIILYCKSGSTTAEFARKNNRAYVPIDKNDNYVLISGAVGYKYTFGLIDSAIYTLTKGGVLTISGTGYMYNFPLGDSPWHNYHNIITKIVIENGIQTVQLFSDCDKVTEMYIPVTVEGFNLDALKDNNITDVYYAGTESEWELMDLNGNEKYLTNANIHFNYCLKNADEKHNYTSEVTAPTCTEQGYTTYVCNCGKTYVADYTNKTPHTYEATITKEPTHTAYGIRTYTCSCGDSYQEYIAKTTEHTYDTVIVTPPTCTERGHTTYRCACGNGYIADFVDALGHSYNSVVIDPTCTEQGYTKYICDCGDSYESDLVDVIDHADADNDYLCDDCGAELYKDSDDNHDAADNCSHICHKTGFLGFFAKIALFFWKLFGTNPVCECGMAHY